MTRWFVIKAHQSIGCERNRGIRPAIVVAKLDFVYSGRQVPNDGTHVATQESFLRNLLYKRHSGQHIEFSHHTSDFDSTQQVVSRERSHLGARFEHYNYSIMYLTPYGYSPY